MDRATFEAELVRDGYAVRESSLPANHNNADHVHDFDARLFVLSGEISVTHGGKTETCRAGDSFALAANTVHFERVGPEGVAYVAGRRTA